MAPARQPSVLPFALLCVAPPARPRATMAARRHHCMPKHRPVLQSRGQHTEMPGFEDRARRRTTLGFCLFFFSPARAHGKALLSLFPSPCRRYTGSARGRPAAVLRLLRRAPFGCRLLRRRRVRGALAETAALVLKCCSLVSLFSVPPCLALCSRHMPCAACIRSMCVPHAAQRVPGGPAQGRGGTKGPGWGEKEEKYSGTHHLLSAVWRPLSMGPARPMLGGTDG